MTRKPYWALPYGGPQVQCISILHPPPPPPPKEKDVKKQNQTKTTFLFYFYVNPPHPTPPPPHLPTCFFPLRIICFLYRPPPPFPPPTTDEKDEKESNSASPVPPSCQQFQPEAHFRRDGRCYHVTQNKGMEISLY